MDVHPESFNFDAKGFSALIDIESFEPEEVSVKTIGQTILVECEHTKDTGEFAEKRFVRKFNFPKDYDMSTVKSTLSNGVLLLEAPKPNIEHGEHCVDGNEEKPSFLMGLLSNRANSLLRRSHSIPSDNEEGLCDAE